MYNKKKKLLSLVFPSIVILSFPLNACETILDEVEAETDLKSCRLKLSVRSKVEGEAGKVASSESEEGPQPERKNLLKSEEIVQDTVEEVKKNQLSDHSEIPHIENAAREIYQFLRPKFHITREVSEDIRYSVHLANLLMNEETFEQDCRHHSTSKLIEILNELKIMVEENSLLKEFWPRVIAALAMNKRAHTPFFLPNRFTLIMPPFPVEVIQFIDQELEQTKSYRVNAILRWMRQTRFVDSDRGYNEKHPRWDVAIGSVRYRVIESAWTCEHYRYESPSGFNQSTVSTMHFSEEPNSVWRKKLSHKGVFINKHFPEEMAELFHKRDENVTTISNDIIQDILVARYLNWLYKANKDGKKVSSFYHPSVTEKDGRASPVDDMHPHARQDNVWGEFPGMYVYEKMKMTGFRLPIRFKTNLSPEELSKKDKVDEFLLTQANRYYTDAAAQGAQTACRYMLKNYRQFYCEYILPIDLKCVTQVRASETLYQLRYAGKQYVKQQYYDELVKLSGCTKENVLPMGKIPAVPPSPRKTPNSSTKDKQRVRKVEGNPILSLVATEVLTDFL